MSPAEQSLKLLLHLRPHAEIVEGLELVFLPSNCITTRSPVLRALAGKRGGVLGRLVFGREGAFLPALAILRVQPAEDLQGLEHRVAVSRSSGSPLCQTPSIM